MHTLFTKIGSIFMTAAVAVSSIFTPTATTPVAPMTPAPKVQEIRLTDEVTGYIDQYIEQSLKDNSILGSSLPIAGQTYTLAGSGVSPSATSFTLQSLTLPQNGYKIQDSNLSDTFFVTLEPGNRARQEIASCTTATQNDSGTATLSGCVRGLSPITPYTASTTLKFSHAGGSQVIFSDPPQLFNLYGAKADNENITGYWTVPDPVGLTDIANKQYVLSVVTGGTVSTNKVIVTGTAGETLSAGQIVYVQTSDARWYKAATTTDTSALLGVAQGSGTAGNAVSGGILLIGEDSNQSGLTVGANYFLSSTAGTIQIATTSRSVGKAKTTTTLSFKPDFALSGQNNTFYGTTTIAATSTLIVGAFPAYQIGKNEFFASSTGASTFAIPSGIKRIWFEMAAAGGGGYGASQLAGDTGGGGGGGGYCTGIVDVTGTTTLTYFIGTGGTAGAGSSGGAGTNSYLINSPNILCGAGGAGGGITAVGGGSPTGGSAGAATTTISTVTTIAGQVGGGGVDVGSFGIGGIGGNSGAGIGGGQKSGGTSEHVGSAGTGFGAGGSAGVGSAANQAVGGAGTGGFLRIRW